MEPIRPDWPAPANVRALVTTRALGNMGGEGLLRLAPLVAGEPVWLKQVHGTTVIDADTRPSRPHADASFSKTRGTVCAVMLADCMPVLLADEKGGVVGAAHAGWRGLSSGVIEATVSAMRVKGKETLAWLGPAIGPKVYEVGEEVRAAFLNADESAETAFVANRPGHWLLDLYAVARQRLAKLGITRIYGGGFCTYTEKDRFFSFRRDKTSERMAALIWLT
jgi:YfiH family protein